MTVTKLENAFQAKNIDTNAYNFTDNHVFGAKAVNQYPCSMVQIRAKF